MVALVGITEAVDGDVLVAARSTLLNLGAGGSSSSSCEGKGGNTSVEHFE